MAQPHCLKPDLNNGEKQKCGNGKRAKKLKRGGVRGYVCHCYPAVVVYFCLPPQIPLITNILLFKPDLKHVQHLEL